MANKVHYKSSVEKDLRRIDHKELPKIHLAIESQIKDNPRSGKPLKGAYKGLFSFRVGNYRIVYIVIPDGVLILRVGNRKDVYANVTL